MPLARRQIRLILWAAVAVSGSCAKIEVETKSPLEIPKLPPDSVVLDIFFVRFPFGDEAANNSLWREVDEQRLPTNVRRELARNGFRIGLIGGQIPVELSQLLELGDKPPPTRQIAQTNLEEMETVPRVVRRHKQLRKGDRCEIVASEVYDELPVISCEPGGLCGKSYPKAQGIVAVKAFPEADGRVRLELIPEVHYGEPRQRYVGGNGMLRLEAGRSRRAFDKMAVSTVLAPGQILALSSSDCRPGSLGHDFFTQETGGQLEQKLLVIRLSQTQHDELFDAVNTPFFER